MTDPLILQLAALRRERDVSQRTIASRAGVSQAQISQIESGRRGASLYIARRYANALGYELVLSKGLE